MDDLMKSINSVSIDFKRFREENFKLNLTFISEFVTTYIYEM